ncbi:methionine ABC transporter permease [Enterococcus phoeniculicola]|jgi:D-methionine transport system permease protein|uniref:ABC transporter permease n=1 Tax=Enterococcus phoeniculicola ATCC BAA-412 TaxID=1158610 RepID=R3TKL8_9ENTE|nr:methionine ABC transporter permease [Enterococcus phoeniculicola]EOL41603.1 ABC transporter permease [Enterococcus phoeniculicola ATCC BAA-412]EOT78903.1 ABC transporter permease [Enterococcus phoeniculicola ATCC BAA-412]
MNKSISEQYFNFSQINSETMKQAIIDTLYMTVISMVLVFVLGLLLGLLLYTIGRKNKPYAKIVYSLVSIISNIFRSTPFMILMVLIIPFTKVLVGSMLGAKAAIPALVLSAAPFYARLVEIALREVSPGVLEAADAMGASYWETIYKVLLPESVPALISGITVTTISMIGFTAMAGAIGAGGLGALAWQEGYQRGNYTVTLVATVIILVIVFIVQGIGDALTKRTDKR